MVYAQIKDALVMNVIVLNDVSLLPEFLVGYDYIIRIDENPLEIGIGWSYDSNTGIFTPPE